MIKQLSLEELQLEGPQIGSSIEYAPYHPGPDRPSPPEWRKAVVVDKYESSGWPDIKRGWNARRTRIALEVEWEDRGKKVRSGCFVDHEGRTWRYPGSDQVHPDPY